MSPYREAPQRYQGLESNCRKCSRNGHLYLYFPTSAGVDAGPLCRSCFIEWRGVALYWRFGTIGASGYYAWPVEDRGGLDARYFHDNVAWFEGQKPDEDPLKGPPLPPTTETWKEKAVEVLYAVTKAILRM